jgi:hypothetical protein
MKYALKINLLKYANNMHKCAIGKYAQICSKMRKYARNMQDICAYMQKMQARMLYVVYADICIPYFADERASSHANSDTP